MSSTVTTSGTIDGTLSLMALAASSDSKTTIPRPESSFRVQYPATNPGACDTPGTTCSRRWLSATSRSLIETVTTTACMTPLLGSSNSSRPYPTGGNPKTPGRSVVGRGADPLGELPERQHRDPGARADGEVPSEQRDEPDPGRQDPVVQSLELAGEDPVLDRDEQEHPGERRRCEQVQEYRQRCAEDDAQHYVQRPDHQRGAGRPRAEPVMGGDSAGSVADREAARQARGDVGDRDRGCEPRWVNAPRPLAEVGAFRVRGGDDRVAEGKGDLREHQRREGGCEIRPVWQRPRDPLGA